MKQCKNACDKEIKFLKKLLENKILIKNIKHDLTKMIYKMEKIGINMKTLLSDSLFTGNIGLNDKNKLIQYIKSDKSSIREKVAAISNSFWDASLEVPRYNNCEIFFKYIMKNRNNTNCKALYESIKIITKNKYPERLDSKNKKISVLWCPLFYLFPGYNFKRNNINLHNLINQKTGRSLRKEELIEPITQYEIDFYNSKNISINKTILNIETGRDLYKNKACRQFNYNNNNKFNCRVAGVSGHAILHFTLALILNINLKSVFFGQMFEMVPIHHSIEEICFGLNDFTFFLTCNHVKNSIKMDLFDNHTEMLRFIKKNFVDTHIKEKKSKYTRKIKKIKKLKNKKKN